jgi:hypothetical protein
LRTTHNRDLFITHYNPDPRVRCTERAWCDGMSSFLRRDFGGQVTLLWWSDAPRNLSVTRLGAVIWREGAGAAVLNFCPFCGHRIEFDGADPEAPTS